MTRFLVALALLVGLSACDRLEVDAIDSQVVVVSPDLGDVLLDPALTLRFQTAGPAVGASVRIDGQDVARDEATGGFVYETSLDIGLNALALEVTDEAGGVERDTLYALYLPVQRSAPQSVSADVQRVGAAAVALDNTRVLITGGVGANGTALSTGALVNVFGTQLGSSTVALARARAEHTASLLPDGRLLLAGGVRTSGSPTPADFVSEVELFAPDGSGSTGAEPSTLLAEVERAGHVARVLRTGNRTFLYLIGGVVPAGGGAAASRTADIFEYVPGLSPSLRRLSPEGGVSIDGSSSADDVPALVNAVEIPTAVQSSVVFGLSQGNDGVGRQLTWRTPGTAYPFSLTPRATASLSTPRDAAAGVSLDAVSPGDGLALVLGGRNADGAALASIEVYASRIDRTFRFPDAVALRIPRFGHTATILGGSRILVAGGRGGANVPVPSLEVLQF